MHGSLSLFFCRFILFRADGRSRIYRRHNERYAANCVVEHDHFGGGSVMVWAGIHHDGRTALVRVNGALSAQIYQDEILQHHVVPLINVTGGIFQHFIQKKHKHKKKQTKTKNKNKNKNVHALQ